MITGVVAVLAFAGAARADSTDTLKAFIHDVKSGKASFTQTVTSPDGTKKKTSSGNFEFVRPDRFRFAYTKPFEQLIVGDGQRVWLHDADLNQVSVRKMSQALGATPAALLAGETLERDFTLSSLPDVDGLSWVRALPKAKDGAFQVMRVGFRGKELAAVEITDAFGQKSLLQFTGVAANAPIPPERFKFTPPAGADVLKE